MPSRRPRPILCNVTAKKIAEPAAYVRAAADLALGKSIRKAQAERVELSHDDVRFCSRWVRSSPEEFTEAIKGELRRTCGMLLHEIQRRIEKIPPSSLGVTYGILQDKLAILEGRPSSITASASVKLGDSDMTPEEVREVLKGTRKAVKPAEKEGDAVEAEVVEG